MSPNPGPFSEQSRPENVRHPYGLPAGTIRAMMSLLICSFFWLLLLLPEDRAFKAPLGHFVLITLVFLAFVSHPTRNEGSVLPWIMRLLVTGGTIAVMMFVNMQHPDRLSERLTPESAEMKMWPVLVGVMAAAFAGGILVRKLLGSTSPLFESLRAWVGVAAMLVLVVETVFQFAIRPTLSKPPSPESLKVWEGIIIGFVSAYFGARA